MKGGLEHILIKQTHDRLAAPKGRDMTSLLRIFSIMTDGVLKHLTTMSTDEAEDEDEDEEEDELAAKRRDLVNLVDCYNEHMKLSRIDAPTGAPPHLVITPSQQHALTRTDTARSVTHPVGTRPYLLVTPASYHPAYASFSPLCSGPGTRDGGGCAQGHPRRRARGAPRPDRLGWDRGIDPQGLGHPRVPADLRLPVARR